MYNNKHDQGGIHGDNLNSNSDAGEELSRISEDGVIVVDPKKRRISQKIRKTSGKSPLLIMLHVLPITYQKIEQRRILEITMSCINWNYLMFGNLRAVQTL